LSTVTANTTLASHFAKTKSNCQVAKTGSKKSSPVVRSFPLAKRNKSAVANEKPRFEDQRRSVRGIVTVAKTVVGAKQCRAPPKNVGIVLLGVTYVGIFNVEFMGIFVSRIKQISNDFYQKKLIKKLFLNLISPGEYKGTKHWQFRSIRFFRQPVQPTSWLFQGG